MGGVHGQDRCSIVRELHVYGSVVPVQSRDPSKFQHQGFGTLLMEEAARIARQEHGSTKIAVISGAGPCRLSVPCDRGSRWQPWVWWWPAGVGTRDYYRKLGYELEGPYMVKRLDVGEEDAFDWDAS